MHALLAEEGTRRSMYLSIPRTDDTEPEPKSYPEACKAEYAPLWTIAMRVEFDGSSRANMFVETKSVPKGVNVVGAKWVFK